MSLPTTDLLEISVPVDGEAAEAVYELFERHGGGAVFETRLAPAADGEPGSDAPGTWVRTYLPADDVAARARVEVGLWHLGCIYPIADALVRHLAQANWAEAWKTHFRPLRVGRHMLIVPSWIEPQAAPEDCVIRLDPGMAFGTGLHPTTQLCLAALEALVRPGMAVLDVGTGSGILAIAAARLGAGRVLALDIDPQAVAIAAENAARNAVVLETFAGELQDAARGAFDLVVANILAGTIIALAPTLAVRVKPGGWLIASGILVDQGADVATALAAVGFAPPTRAHSGDWVALTARGGSAGRVAQGEST